jgi:UDP-GlcNAc3NAcA epimerase
MHNSATSGCKRKLLTVVGARPQFVKAAVVSRCLRDSKLSNQLEEVLVHTGQHYDPMMSDVFFRELGIPDPAYNLEVGSGSGAQQMARIQERLGPVLEQERPEMVLVYGDTHSTLAASITAAHLDIPVAHVEAGERIFRRWRVPEETNRVLTDNNASLCLTCTERATNHLLREGFAPERVKFVGDPMYDLFQWACPQLPRLTQVTPASFGLAEGGYHLATIHRAQNTADPQTVIALFEVLDQAELPVLLPVHPRVQELLKMQNWGPRRSLRLTSPLGYIEFLRMLLSCQRCITDSGGVSREAFFARRPCILPMENCWWPEIVEAGWMVETGSDPARLLEAIDHFEPRQAAPTTLFGDGRSAEKILHEVNNFVEQAQEAAWHRFGTFRALPGARATDFTYSNYRRFLDELGAAGYRFRSFPEAEAALGSEESFLLLRHDIDLSLEKAVSLAEVEHQAGVQATYFFMVRTAHYNPFSASGSAAVRRILQLGHHLGLHFDCAAYPEGCSLAELAESCRTEAEMLEAWFKTLVSVVSYHRPNSLVLSGDAALSVPRLHTYMPLFTKPITYFSDSRGEWAKGDPRSSETFAKRQPMHILVHPIWWNPRPIASFETLERFVDTSRRALERSVASNCTVYRIGSNSGDPSS